MKKKSVLILLSIIFLIGLKVFIVNQENADNKAPITLSEKEKIEDFNYLYDVLKDNFPFFQVNKRKFNVDWLNNKEKYINIIKNTKNDLEFENKLAEIISQLNIGHTHLVSKSFYNYLIEGCSLNRKLSDSLTDIIESPKVMERYNYNDNTEEIATSQDNSYNVASSYYSDIITPEKTAYLCFRSFKNQNPQGQIHKIYEFLSEIKDYSSLIIDIRGNGGGNILNWINNLVSPLIDEPTSYKRSAYFRGGEYSKNFLHFNFPQYSSAFTKVTKDSKLPGQDTLTELKNNSFKYYASFEVPIYPTNQVNFKGKIFLLVDKDVYSAAEEFSQFCKDTGWATLVGENTGGGSVVMNPTIMALPNSSYLVRFPIDFTLNKDNTINEEVGTEPDIHVDASIGETYEKDKAIQKVLQLVKEADSKESASACF